MLDRTRKLTQAAVAKRVSVGVYGVEELEQEFLDVVQDMRALFVDMSPAVWYCCVEFLFSSNFDFKSNFAFSHNSSKL